MRKSKFVVPDHFYDETHAFDFGIGLVPVFLGTYRDHDMHGVVTYDGYFVFIDEDYDLCCDAIDWWLELMRKDYLLYGPDWFYRTKCDVEANSQDAAAALPKCTASDLDPRGAGDVVSLDQHINLYQEVLHG